MRDSRHSPGGHTGPPLHATRYSWRRIVGLLLILGVLGFNGVAWVQAWAMTHYTTGGPRTAQPEALTLGDKVAAVFTGVRVSRPENTQTPTDFKLSYEVHHIPLGAGEQLEAWYVPHISMYNSDRGRGLVLMFPGYAASKDSLLAPADALSRIHYDILLVDFRGEGGSSGQDTTLGVREAVDVAQAVAYARRTWPRLPLVLYGESMGSAAVLRAVAVEGVHPDAVILASPFDRLLTTTENRFHAMGLPAFPAAPVLVFWGSVQEGFNGFTHNPVDYAAAVQCPGLVLYGAQDPRVTPDQARAVYDHLGGRKQFVTVPNAGHESLIAVDPQLWQQEVGQFLDQIGVSP